MESQSPAYMLFFHELPPSAYASLSEAEKQQLGDAWNDWYNGLASEGKVTHAHPLTPAVRVVSGSQGERVLDGPFAEAKEAIGGYFFLTVASLDEATEIARRCPSLRLGMRIEVREVAEFCPDLQVRGRGVTAGAAR